MDNTDDTPMDKEEPNWVTKYNNSPVNKKRQNVVESVSEHFNGGSGDTATLYDIAKFVEPLLKENESLKLELQKQKELNAELVEALEWILEDANSPDYEGCFSEASHIKAKALIKKSSEI